jgi:phage terminase Nu1 subunit (DNA packaging protein)
MAKSASKAVRNDDVSVDAPTLARLCRLDVRTILKLAEQGIVVRVARGRYAQRQSVGNLLEHYRARAAGRESQDGSIDVVKANAALRDSQRRLNDLKIAQLEGRLISLPEVEAAWDEVAATIKQLFLTFPVRARADLPHLTGTDQKLLYKLAREMLTEVATEGRVRLPPSATSRQCEAKIGAGR